MALRGNLQDFSAIQMLNLISVARKSGTLTVDGVDAKARMLFREGNLHYAAVGDRDYRLTEVLRRGGNLTEAQLGEVEVQATSTNDRELAWLLLRAGHVNRSDIIRSVRTHILRGVFEVFEWSQGTFVFESNQPSFGDRITVPIELANVIVAGSRRLRQARLLREALPSLDVPLRLAPGARDRLRKMRMGLDEWRVVSMAGPGTTLRQIANRTDLSDEQTRRVVYGLLQADLVELETAAETPAPTTSEAQSSDRARVRRPNVRRNVILRLIDRIRKL